MTLIIFSYQFRLKVVFLKSQFQPFKTVVLDTPDLNPLTHSHHVYSATYYICMLLIQRQ